MRALRLMLHKPLTLLLASAAAATMLFISEGTYWRAASTLERLSNARLLTDAGQTPAQLAQESEQIKRGRQEILTALKTSRIGVAALSLISLVALFFYLRQLAVVQRHEDARKDEALADHQRLEAEVARRTAELTSLTRNLFTAREDERSRLARDLHDELGALLTSAKLDAARVRARLGSTAPEAQDRLAHLVQTLNSGIALKRRIIEDLRPSALAHLGLVATLEILAREFQQRSGLQVVSALEPVALDADTELTVYRLVQEAITNISKHAKAGRVWIDLAPVGNHAVVSVRDDGVGFDVQARPASAHGLMGMRFRVRADGGELELWSAPGAGTTIRVQLPLATPVPA